MDNAAAAVMQVILNRLNKLEATVVAQSATIDANTEKLEDVTSRLEEVLDRALVQKEILDATYVEPF